MAQPKWVSSYSIGPRWNSGPPPPPMYTIQHRVRSSCSFEEEDLAQPAAPDSSPCAAKQTFDLVFCRYSIFFTATIPLRASRFSAWSTACPLTESSSWGLQIHAEGPAHSMGSSCLRRRVERLAVEQQQQRSPSRLTKRQLSAVPRASTASAKTS